MRDATAHGSATNRPIATGSARRGAKAQAALVTGLLFALMTLGGCGSAAQDGTQVSAETVADTTSQAPSEEEPSKPAPVSIVDDATGETIDALERPRFTDVTETHTYEPVVANVEAYTVADDLSNVAGIDGFRYIITDEMASHMSREGFVVDMRPNGGEYFEVYEINRYAKIPSFVTVDAAMHTYHLLFQHVQKTCERQALAGRLLEMSQELLATSTEQLKELEGSEWQSAAERNVAFFAVATQLLSAKIPERTAPGIIMDLSIESLPKDLPAPVIDTIINEYQNVVCARDAKVSQITGEREDYTQYMPQGYYAGEPTLIPYFKTMLWYGRTNFTCADEDLDRSALLATLALKDEALSAWEDIYAVTSFFAGESDDNTYSEYRPLLEAAYGKDVTCKDLIGNDEAWQHFHALTAKLPDPQVNSTIATNANSQDGGSLQASTKGFRVFGQRTALDELIYTQLTYPALDANGEGVNRLLPDALDLPAALGSDVAYDILDGRGATGFAGYDENLKELRTRFAGKEEDALDASLSTSWFATLRPLLAEKGAGYPMFMASDAWRRKDLQTYLGSYTELAHDTALYRKAMMIAEGGGGPMGTDDDRGYVECEPEVFERLADLADTTSERLADRDLIDEGSMDSLSRLSELSRGLAVIARKELAGETVTDDEYELIRSFGLQIEHIYDETCPVRNDDGCGTVASVATNANDGVVLECATNNPKDIYVVVPVDGGLRLARGAVFCFHEFEQDADRRLTDKEWRSIAGRTDKAVAPNYTGRPEDWAADFIIDPGNAAS